MKEVAPSPALRTWFGHEPNKFAEFREKYNAELRGNPAVEELRRLHEKHGTVTLLYAARDARINHAQVLRDFLTK
jgi:uncharacterized protein YeaO (DUF488 family)